MLAACGSDSPTAAPAASTAHGTLAVSPPLRVASVDAATFQAQISASPSGAQLLQVTGNPTCGVDFYYINFWTVGAVGETTKSSGALMVPTGAAPACSGPRPIVLYGHGTQFEKAFNIADIANPTNTEGALIAATFAAQGYIVVAPNFAGYDISTLGYHPFLNAAQQSGEMIDALTAGGRPPAAVRGQRRPAGTRTAIGQARGVRRVRAPQRHGEGGAGRDRHQLGDRAAAGDRSGRTQAPQGRVTRPERLAWADDCGAPLDAQSERRYRSRASAIEDV